MHRPADSLLLMDNLPQNDNLTENTPPSEPKRGNGVNRAPKLPPNSWDESQLAVFSKRNEVEIRSLAPGLELDEILEYYNIESLDDLPDYDRLFLEVTFKRARIIAKQNATAHLISSMVGANALSASLAYLTRFGNESWKDSNGTGVKPPKGIRIVLDE